MKEQVSFISREDVLQQIEAIIANQETRKVVCIKADGGIGKTRLLQELHRRQQPFIPEVLPGGFHRKEISLALVQEFTNSEWDQQFFDGVRWMAKELNVKVLHTDAHFDIDQMVADLDAVIEKKPEAIFMCLGTDPRLRPGIQRAIEKGIKFLTLDNFLTIPDGVTVRVFQDNLLGCKAISERMAEDLHFKGKIAVVWVQTEMIHRKRKEILDTILGSNPGIQVAAEFGVIGESWIEDTRQKAKEALEQDPDIQAFWVVFDELAKAVVQALVDLKRGDIGVYSFDLNPSSVDLILSENSPWRATAATHPYEIGKLAVRLSTLAAYGADIQPQYLLPMRLVTQSELRQMAEEGKDFLEHFPFPQIGWSPLIEALQKRKQEEKRGLQVLDIVDFDDHKNRISQNVASFIASSLDVNAFQDYFQMLLKFRRLEEEIVNPDQLAAKRDEVNETFIQCFNRVTQNRRVVLLFDTSEKIENTEVWNDLLTLSQYVQNAVFIYAGRTTHNIHADLKPILGDEVTLIELENLDAASTLRYLEEKQKLLHYRIPDKLIPKIALLSQGRPILIDLAVEWLARDLPLPWMQADLKRLKANLKNKAKKEKLQKDFAQELVIHITNGRRPIDWLWLVLAWINPLDVPMIASILRKSHQEALELFDEAKTYVFVKALPSEKIALHDEMAKMVLENVWPNVDPQGERRRLYSRLTVKYLDQKAKALDAEILHSERTTRVGGRRELNVFFNQEMLLQELWVLQELKVKHTFLVSLKEGLSEFMDLFIQAERQKWFSFEELLLQQARDFKPVLEEADRFEVEIREAIYAINMNNIQDARQNLVSLQQKYADNGLREVDILSRLANCERLSGGLPKAIGYLSRALEICETNESLKSAYGGTLVNTLGLVYRQMGMWDEAEKNYNEAIKLIEATGDEAKLSVAYNNLGYIVGLKSEYESALRYSLYALKTQERIGLEMESARTHNTLGIIFRSKGEYPESLTHIEQAISIFNRKDNQEWLAKAYCERGTTKWYQEDLEGAEEDLKRSRDEYIKSRLKIDLPTILHRLGHVAWERDLYDEAESYFRDSEKYGRDVSDYQQIVNSLEGLVELFYYRGYFEGNKRKNFNVRDHWYALAQETAESWAKEFDIDGPRFPLYTGSRYRILGNIAFDLENYDQALDYYKKAYPLLASRGGYSRYMLGKALDWLQERIDELDPDRALSWCDQLIEFWEEEEKKGITYPEMLTTCRIARRNARARKAGVRI